MAEYATLNFVSAIFFWNQERGLLEAKFDKDNEENMLWEECMEFQEAKDPEEMIDALADIIVVAIGTMFKLGYKPNDVMYETLKEITSRTGSINPETGKWEKDPNAKTYKANYAKCKQGYREPQAEDKGPKILKAEA